LGYGFLFQQGYTLSAGWQFDAPIIPIFYIFYGPVAKGLTGLVRAKPCRPLDGTSKKPRGWSWTQVSNRAGFTIRRWWAPAWRGAGCDPGRPEPDLKRAVAFGVSQKGRFLRTCTTASTWTNGIEVFDGVATRGLDWGSRSRGLDNTNRRA
jgi:hypothetical protein